MFNGFPTFLVHSNGVASPVDRLSGQIGGPANMFTNPMYGYRIDHNNNLIDRSNSCTGYKVYGNGFPTLNRW